jgi:iron complex outermembrane receptor protein
LGTRIAQQNSRLRSSFSSYHINRAIATTVGTTWQFSPDWRFYLRRAGSFRFPKADENASTPPGIAGLRTQRGISYEAGFDITKEHYGVKLSLYQLNLRDEIVFDPLQTPQDPFGTNRNLSPTVRQGFTISGRRDINCLLSLDGQYNYVNARFQNGLYKGNRIPLVSESIFRTGLNYHINEHWHAFTEALFTGNQYAANDNANIAGKLGGYTIYHFSIRYVYEHLTASFRINNIFNHYYYFYTVYQPNVMSEFFYPAPGRNFTLTVQYMFT